MQSRDEIAEQIIEQAGSIGAGRVTEIRKLVAQARREGIPAPSRDDPDAWTTCAQCDTVIVRGRTFCHQHSGPTSPEFKPESPIGSDGASLGQSPGGELPVERRATSGPVVSLEERERVDEPFEPWARRQIEKLAAILLPLESSMSKMRERVYEIVREEIALVRGGEDPHAETKRTGEGRAEAALSGNVAGPSTQPVQASPTGVREGVSAVDEGSAASRQAAPFPDPIPAWMPSAHELRNAHANRNYAFQADASDYEPFERIRRLIASRSPSKLPTPEDVAAPIRAALEASRSPSHELVEAADALRNEMTMPSDGSFAPFVDRSLKDKIEAYDAARSRHASGAQPDSACDESGWLVEITGPKYWTGTPGCGNWTADSLAAMRFARRQDAEAACRHLAPSGAIPVEHAWVSHRPAGAQPSGAPAKWRVEVVHGRARVIVDASGDSGEQSFWINDADTDDEPGHAEFHARMLRIAIGRILGAPAPAPLGTLPAFHTLEECREVFRRVTKRGPCLSSEDLHGIAAIRDFLTLTPEQFRENWGQQEDAPASAQGEIAKSAPNERTHSMSDAGDACGCRACNPSLVGVRMIWCETCGNKRCPHANDHRNTCTNSNEPGQPGSAYPAWKPASAQGEVCEKCSGAGWVWGHELPTPEETPTDTRYSCPACRVTNIDGTPPSSEKTGEERK